MPDTSCTNILSTMASLRLRKWKEQRYKEKYMKNAI